MLVALISCTKAKTAFPAPARELYSPSALFRGAMAYVSGRATATYVLSAKYGLLPLDQVVAPYDQTLLTMSEAERSAWARNVLADLQGRYGTSLKGITCEFHAGTVYRVPLEALLKNAGATCTCPVAGLPIGERLAFYNRKGTVPSSGKPPAVAKAAPARQPVSSPATPADLRSHVATLRGQTLGTGTGAPFVVASVGSDRVVIIPESTCKPRPILWREIADAHAYLLRQRVITLADVRAHASEANPAYLFAILATLPGARLERGRPLRLHL